MIQDPDLFWDHPLEISGQAGKENSFGFLNQFKTPHGNVVC
jgi:hypothetical protein